LRKLTGAISKSKTVVIFTNQLRQKIGVMFGNPETTTGGLALKFYASVRMDSRKIESIKEGDEIIGSRHRVRVVKNKVAPPFKVAEFDIFPKGGISKVGGILDVALDLGVVERSGAFYRYGEIVLGQGKSASIDSLTGNQKLTKEIEEKIWQEVKSGKATEERVIGRETA